MNREHVDHTLTPGQITQAKELGERMYQAQEALWDLSTELENVLDIEIDTTDDLSRWEDMDDETVQEIVNEYSEAQR